MTPEATRTRYLRRLSLLREGVALDYANRELSAAKPRDVVIANVADMLSADYHIDYRDACITAEEAVEMAEGVE